MASYFICEVKKPIENAQPVNEFEFNKSHFQNMKKDKLKNDLIRVGALKVGEPVYKSDVDKIVKYALNSEENMKRVQMAKAFHHMRPTAKSDEEVKFWKEVGLEIEKHEKSMEN